MDINKLTLACLPHKLVVDALIRSQVWLPKSTLEMRGMFRPGQLAVSLVRHDVMKLPLRESSVPGKAFFWSMLVS